MRAAALNPAASRLMGVRVGWMLALGWGFAAVLGAIAGMMAAPIGLPRSEHDARRPDLRIRRRGARRHRQPDRRGRRRPRCSASLVNLLGAYVDFVGHELTPADARSPILLVVLHRPADRACSAVCTCGGSEPALRHHRRSEWLVVLGRAAWSLAAPAARRRRVPPVQLTFVAIYFIALLGLNILTGYNGQISLGHGAFMAIGATSAAR